MKKIIIVFCIITQFSCSKKEEFQFDFNTEKEYVYSITQTTHIVKTDRENKSSESYVSGKGMLIIESKANNLADLRFEDFTSKTKNSSTNDTLFKIEDNQVIKNLKSDGTFLSEKKQNSLGSLKMIPLPTKKLSVGESDDIPHTLPLRINDTTINSIGTLELIFSGYETFKGKTCAVLKGTINISELELPKNSNGNYKLSEFGNGTYYFDLEKKCFVSTIVEFETKKLIDTKSAYEKSIVTNRFEINLLENREVLKEEINKINSSIIEIPENTPNDVAKSVIEFLVQKDTLKYLNIAIPLEEQKKLFAYNIRFNPQESDTSAIYKRLEQKYSDRTDNFLVRAGYILEIMKRDNDFEIEKATIDTMYYKLEKMVQYGSFSRTIIADWADLTVEMTYKGEKYYLEIPQIINVDNKWYLYYPAYYFRDQREKDFVDRRVIELKKQAEEFWK